jgi:hypothetical protein
MTSTTGSAPRPTPFDLKELFKASWDLFAAKPIEHIVAAAVIYVVGILTLGIMLGPLLVAYIRMIERQRRGEPIEPGQLFELDGLGMTAFATALLVGWAFVCGLVVFVLPGLLALLAWGFSFWFIAVDRQGTIAAMASSWRLLNRHTGNVVVVWVILLVLESAGFGSLILGCVITLPLATLFATVAFSELRRLEQQAPPATVQGV